MPPEPAVVLVDHSSDPRSTARLARVARALQTQVVRDFDMVWGGRASVAVATGEALPAGAWTIAITGDTAVEPGIRLDRCGIPHATVRAGAGWTSAASRALLEMIANPDGARFIEGRDVTPRSPVRSVRYLVEVCGPCRSYQYEIDGVQVSDFVTPDFYRGSAAPGTAFDFLRRVRRPLAVPRGGCLSWQDPADGRWHRKGTGGMYAVSDVPIDPLANPRADRDGAFRGEAGVRRSRTKKR
jgi:hypothetical protein